MRNYHKRQIEELLKERSSQKRESDKQWIDYLARTTLNRKQYSYYQSRNGEINRQA